MTRVRPLTTGRPCRRRVLHSTSEARSVRDTGTLGAVRVRHMARLPLGADSEPPGEPAPWVNSAVRRIVRTRVARWDVNVPTCTLQHWKDNTPHMKLSKIMSEHDALEARGMIPRDHHKRPLIWARDGSKRVPYRRPSSLSDPLDDKSSLMPWSQGRALIGAARDASVLTPLQEAIESGMDFDEAEGKALAKKQAAIAFESGGGNSRADKGSLWHEVLEQIDKGEEPFVPDDYEDYVSAYKKLMSDCRRILNLAIEDTELFGVYDDEQIAGTMDVLMWIDWDSERKLVIGDKKTSGTLAYSMGKFSMQLHAYSRMVRYDPAAALRGEDAHGLGVGRAPMTPEHVTADGDIGFIFHLPLGKAEAHLVPLDISRGTEGLRLAAEVREWRNSWARKASRPVPLLSAGASSCTPPC